MPLRSRREVRLSGKLVLNTVRNILLILRIDRYGCTERFCRENRACLVAVLRAVGDVTLQLNSLTDELQSRLYGVLLGNEYQRIYRYGACNGRYLFLLDEAGVVFG